MLSRGRAVSKSSFRPQYLIDGDNLIAPDESLKDQKASVINTLSGLAGYSISYNDWPDMSSFKLKQINSSREYATIRRDPADDNISPMRTAEFVAKRADKTSIGVLPIGNGQLCNLSESRVNRNLFLGFQSRPPD